MTQPEALRLAEYLERGGDFPPTLADAAAELRLLVAQRDALLDLLKEALDVVAQRDALLEAFSLLRVECHQLHHNFKDRHTMLEPCPVVARINAAIKKAEENT